MTTQYWLVKSEPSSYSWDDLQRDGETNWTGVRSHAGRLHLQSMHVGDRVLFYESVTTKAVVGIAEVTRAAFADDTADEPGWVAVALRPLERLAEPVTLSQVKTDRALAAMELLRQSRLSVQPVRAAEFARILELGGAAAAVRGPSKNRRR